MKYLITGGGGQLGYELKKELLSRGINKEDILSPRSKVMDITDYNAVEKTVEKFHPDVIFHCAAFTDANAAETNQESCQRVNVDGTKNITRVAELYNAKLIYISTDYVFDGAKTDAYTTEDQPKPINVYGRTKFAGEQVAAAYPKHFIVRIAWVFGINGKNFFRTMLNLSKTRDEVTVVDDQVGSPTYTVDLVKFLVDLAESDKYGIYHATNEGFCSWADFAKEIFRVTGKKTKVKRVSTPEYLKVAGQLQAPRPAYSKLDKSKLEANGFAKLPTWQDAVKRYAIELKKEGEL